MFSKAYRIKLVFLLFSVMFIMGIARSGIGIAAPVIIKEFHLDASAMGVILSAFFWTYTLFNLPAGNLADKYGSKLVLGWAVVIWSLSAAAVGIVGNVIGLIVTRLGVGIGEAAVFPVTTKVVADNFSSKERGTVIGWYQSGARLGYAAAPIIMGFLIAKYDWEMAFVISGLGSLVWCVIWYFWFRDDTKVVVKEKQDKKSTPWLQLLTNRCTLGLFIAKFCGDYLYYMFLTWVPSYLVMERGFSIIKMGFYASLPFVVAFITQPITGYLSDWLIKRGTSVTWARKSVLVGAQLAASSIMAVGFIDDPLIAIGVLAINIAAASTVGGMMFTLASEVAPEGMTGTVTGSVNTVGAISGVLAPTLTGIIVQFTGTFQLALIFSGVLLLIAACSVLFIIPEIKPMNLKKSESV